MTPRSHIHVYPIDASLTPDEAWEEIRLMGKRTTFTGSETWGTIECNGMECSQIEVMGESNGNE